MDDFVCNKLIEWRLSDWIPKFKDEGIDEESLYCLEEKDIDKLMPTMGPRARFKRRLQLLKNELNMSNQETADLPAQAEEEEEEEEEAAASSAQVLPSTSDTSNTGKRKSEVLDKSIKWQSPTKRQCGAKSESYTEKFMVNDVKHIMRCVYQRLPNQDNKLNKFLKNKISNLETDKRELVGVFGKTGAGKSSLINAVIGEKNLLPSGSISACTTVVIKVEANMQSKKYEAEIEFIKKEEWKDELWSLFNFLGDDAEEQNDEDDDSDTVEKLTAVYGEEWRGKSPENLTENKYFREIQEFLTSKSKFLTCESAKELSAKLVKYTRSDSEQGKGKEAKRWYWPLVKCVTVRVPNNDLLQHVTLVDLPGNGDRNKSRDEMWKGVVGSCSAVWVVTEINRAAAEKEAWEILESASSIMGNGGECQYIHFICTKSDITDDSDYLSAADVRALIYRQNMQAKDQVRKQFRKLHQVKKHFNDDCFEVFTVSSKEFQKKKYLEPEDTEIPKLQEFLQNLNDRHSQTFNYVSGAYGILSLIQGSRKVGKNTDMCKELEKNIRDGLDKLRKPIKEAYETFEKCLTEGVEKCQSSCEKISKSTLYPPRTSGRGFHRKLKSLVKNGGVHKPKKGKQINLNVRLASGLTDSIDEDFKKTFPNERKFGSFNGVISTFSLGTESLIQKYKDAELQLVFLKTEEEKVKTDLNNIIRERKKAIYNSLTATVEAAMQDCYRKAEEFRGQDTLKNMRDTIMEHVHNSKNTMFQQAKDKMLKQLRDLEEEILTTLRETLFKAIELSLSRDGNTIPDVAVELDMVKRYYNNLKRNPDEETSLCIDLTCTADDLPDPAASLHP